MYQIRRKKYFNLLNENSATILFSGSLVGLSADQNYDFCVCKNFFYLANLEQADSILVMVKTPTRNITKLFLKVADSHALMWDGDTISFEEASKLSEIPQEDIHNLDFFQRYLKTLISPSSFEVVLNTLYFDIDPHNLIRKRSKSGEFIDYLNNEYKGLIFKNCYEYIIRLRTIKDKEEVNKIQSAINLCKNALYDTIEKIK